MLQGIGHCKAGKIDQHRAHGSTGGKRPDHGPKLIAKTNQHESTISDDAAAEANQKRWHLHGKPARIPHDSEGQHGDKQAERPRFAKCREHSGEADIMVKAQDVAELYQEQQNSRHVLEAGHDRMRREFDQ